VSRRAASTYTTADLHAELKATVEKHGVSLNQLVIALLGGSRQDAEPDIASGATRCVRRRVRTTCPRGRRVRSHCRWRSDSAAQWERGSTVSRKMMVFERLPAESVASTGIR
jgi:hypothetical protein